MKTEDQNSEILKLLEGRRFTFIGTSKGLAIGVSIEDLSERAETLGTLTKALANQTQGEFRFKIVSDRNNAPALLVLAEQNGERLSTKIFSRGELEEGAAVFQALNAAGLPAGPDMSQPAAGQGSKREVK